VRGFDALSCPLCTAVLSLFSTASILLGGMPVSGQGSTGNVVAALCSFFIPGLGQLVQGRLFSAIFYFVVVATFYATFIFYLVGIFFHIVCVLSAALFKG
jgi:TM2 domain-containing membrane protein YozV